MARRFIFQRLKFIDFITIFIFVYPNEYRKLYHNINIHTKKTIETVLITSHIVKEINISYFMTSLVTPIKAQTASGKKV